MTPGATKTLHLYEARFLSLLERVLAEHSRGGRAPFVGHVVVDSSFNPAGAAACPGSLVCRDPGDAHVTMCFATLCRVVSVQRVGVGAMVSLQCEGRLALGALRKSDEPYMLVDASVLLDEPAGDAPPGGRQGHGGTPAGGAGDGAPGGGPPLQEAAEELARELCELAELCERVYPEEEGHDAPRRALEWAELVRSGSGPGPGSGGGAGGAGGPVPLASGRADEFASRVSHAALVPVPGMGQEDKLMLFAARVEALSGLDVAERLRTSGEYVRAVSGPLRARLSLMSLGSGPEESELEDSDGGDRRG